MAGIAQVAAAAAPGIITGIFGGIDRRKRRKRVNKAYGGVLEAGRSRENLRLLTPIYKLWKPGRNQITIGVPDGRAENFVLLGPLNTYALRRNQEAGITSNQVGNHVELILIDG